MSTVIRSPRQAVSGYGCSRHAGVPRGMKLLAHVPFFDAGDAAAQAERLKRVQLSQKGVDSVGKLKSSSLWRNFTFAAVTRLLKEMDERYTMFERVDVVVDVNSLNSFQNQLRSWAATSLSAQRVVLQVAVHHNLSHPYRTTWAHRAHVASHIHAYDWFLYTEADVFVPAGSMRAQVELAPTLYARSRKLLGFTRMVSNMEGDLFFSDIRQPVKSTSAFVEANLGTFGIPDNAYAAAWAYPRQIMVEFVQSKDWLPELRSTRGMREKAGVGWRSGAIVVRLDNLTALRVFHVGKSGIFYMRRRGFNSLPAQDLLPHRS